GGRTLNAEVLDGEEMHLVTVRGLSWVPLTTNDFVPRHFDKLLASADMNTEVSEARNLLKTMDAFGRFFNCSPETKVYDFASSASLDVNQSAVTEVANASFY